MAGLSAFLAGNAKKVEPITYAASARFLDDKGQPVLWTLGCITSMEDEALRARCMRQSFGQEGPELDINLYMGLLAARCTLYPDLNDAGLQDSYGVMGADTLLKSLLTPGEYNEYILKVQQVNGMDKPFAQLVEDAKN